MNTGVESAIIIGASLNGLIAAKFIADSCQQVVIVEQGSAQEVSVLAREHLSDVLSLPNVRILFNTGIERFLTDASGAMIGVRVQQQSHDLESLSAELVIDASAIDSPSPRCLDSLAYEPVPYVTKQIVISAPRTQTVTLASYQYHHMALLPHGLFIIGNALSNIAGLAGQEDKLAMIQATMLKPYLAARQDNLLFQKNVARIVGIVIREYVHMAKNQVQMERNLDTRHQFVGASQ